MSEYKVKVERVDPGYNQDAGYNVKVWKPGLPPHSREFYTSKQEADKRVRKLRKSLS